jgi:hypothetical protein
MLEGMAKLGNPALVEVVEVAQGVAATYYQMEAMAVLV